MNLISHELILSLFTLKLMLQLFDAHFELLIHGGLDHSQTAESVQEHFGFPFVDFAHLVYMVNLLWLDQILIIIWVKAGAVIGGTIVFVVIRNRRI